VEKIMDKKEDQNKEAFKVEGNWAIQAQKLKRKYTVLTDADLKFHTGDETDLLNRMTIKLDKNREEVIAIINNC
jgi:hypothetical protein